MPPSEKTPSKNRLNLSLDLRIIVVALLLVIAGMLALWKPWDSSSTSSRTIQVSGEATIKAEPDEFVFYPSYEKKNTDRTAALAELSKKSGEIVAAVKKLGVADNKIKTNAADYQRGLYFTGPDTNTYNLTVTITVGSKEMAQKVQDYITTTDPSGAITPSPDFSDAKRKSLEGQARTAAEKDSRSKAEQSAKNVGFKLGKVKTITEGTGFGSIMTGQPASISGEKMDAAVPSLSVQPGENELSYSISVTYFIK